MGSALLNCQGSLSREVPGWQREPWGWALAVLLLLSKSAGRFTFVEVTEQSVP